MLEVERTIRRTEHLAIQDESFNPEIFCRGVRYIQLAQVEEDLEDLSFLRHPVAKLALTLVKKWLEGYVKRLCG